jgi:hypothetical protein
MKIKHRVRAGGLLVLGYIERASWRLLDAYPQLVKSLIRKKAGIYALYKNERLYYVGLAGNLMGRVKQHLKDRHAGAWDRFSVYLTSQDGHIKPLESLVLRIVNPPKGNSVQGRLKGSENLSAVINRSMSEFDADRRAALLGGKFARRRRRSKTLEMKGTLALAGLVDRRLRLVADYKGRRHKASLRKDGRISFRGRLYDSPSAAAQRILHRGAANGWHFWRYRDTSKGRWVRLSHLRR